MTSAPPPTLEPQRAPRLALLSDGTSPHNDNHARIIAALTLDGWEVSAFKHSELCVLETGVCAGLTPLIDYDLVWMLGLGEQHDFLDRCQILANLPSDKLVNGALASLSLHSKHITLPHAPLTFSGNNAEELAAATRRHAHIGRWVVKPSAGSYGRGVVRTECFSDLVAALKRATTAQRYCIVQAYVEEIRAGETRSLIVNGTVIGSYLRVPDRDFLANLSRGGQPRETELDTQQKLQIQEVSNFLLQKGVRFAAVDMAFPWLIEVNISNPGGLATLAGLEGADKPDVGQRMATALRSLLSA